MCLLPERSVWHQLIIQYSHCSCVKMLITLGKCGMFHTDASSTQCEKWTQAPVKQWQTLATYNRLSFWIRSKYTGTNQSVQPIHLLFSVYLKRNDHNNQSHEEGQIRNITGSHVECQANTVACGKTVKLSKFSDLDQSATGNSSDD